VSTAAPSVAADIRRIAVADLVEAQRLVAAHWQEVASDRDLRPLDPDWPRYLAMEKAGVVLLLGAFVDGKLVGYALGIVTPDLHSRGLIVYQNDALFLAPSHRRSRLGIRLIEASEEAAEARGARYFIWHAKEGSALERLLRARSYSVKDVLFARRAGT
jgi:GNAT superfamily N-acetyltransferase